VHVLVFYPLLSVLCSFVNKVQPARRWFWWNWYFYNKALYSHSFTERVLS